MTATVIPPMVVAVNPPLEVANAIGALLGWMAWMAGAACVAGVLLAVGRLVSGWHRGDAAGAQQLVYVIAAAILLGSAASLVAALL